jgi:hypothetical protein
MKELKLQNFPKRHCRHVQGASGIAARFLNFSPASTVCPIMTKFSQYTPHSTCYIDWCPFAGKIKGPSTGESESSHCQNNPRRMREDGELKILKTRDLITTVQSISLYQHILVKILNFFDKINLH